MQIGVIYPQTELGGAAAAIDAIGRATEALGYDYLLMFDHVLGAHRDERRMSAPYCEKDPFHDPMVAFGYLSAITERIGLATGILVLPQRQTALVARQAADVALLSGDRLRLGVGVGWNDVEYEALGKNFTTRGRRLDEQIPLLRRLWSDTLVTFKGEFDQIDQAGLNPKPGKPIPIWCGGSARAAFERAARAADGFVFSGSFAEQILPAWKHMQEFLRIHDRPVETFGSEYLTPQATSLDSAVELARRWRDAGGTHFGVRTMGLGFSTIGQHIDYLAKFRERLR